MSSTEGSGGGAPIVLGREPVEKPMIDRGDVVFDTGARAHQDHPDGRVTFTLIEPGFAVTYHHAEMMRRDGPIAHAFVRRDTVVTWEHL